MLESILSVLNEACRRFGDTRLYVCEVKIDSLEGARLSLSGRVMDDAQRLEIRRAVLNKFPMLDIDDHNIYTLRRSRPTLAWVNTNLTSLQSGTSFLSEMLSQMMAGTQLEILEEKDRWVYVRQMDGYLGWAYRPYLSDQAPLEPTHIVTAPVSLLLDAPAPDGALMTRVLGGTYTSVLDVRGEWAQISTNRTGWVPLSDLTALNSLPQNGEERRAALMMLWPRLVGVPYLWGGSSAHGIDCSGFAQLLHRWIGQTLPRDADMQYTAGKPVEPPFTPGDLVFFGEKEEGGRITHVALSLGGWDIVHSSRSRNGVYVDNVQEVEHLRESYLCGCTYQE